MTQSDTSQHKPCFHMKGLLDAWQQKRLPGWLVWYVRYHVTHCTRCREALDAFRQVRERLRHFGTITTAQQSDTLSPERKSLLQAAMQEIDRSRNHTEPPP